VQHGPLLPPRKRRRRRARPVSERGPFESVAGLSSGVGQQAVRPPVKRDTAGSIPAPRATRAWRRDRQPAFFRRGTLGGFHTSRDGARPAEPAGSPRGRPLQVRALSRAHGPRGGSGNHASLRSSRCRFKSGRGRHGDVGQRKAAGPSTRKRRVQLPPSSPCPHSSLSRSPGLQPGEGGSKPPGGTTCPRSLTDQAPGYGPG
jgi:hypothetical protein